MTAISVCQSHKFSANHMIRKICCRIFSFPAVLSTHSLRNGAFHWVVLDTPRLSPKQLRAIFLSLWIIINYMQKVSGKMTFLRTLQSRYTSSKREKVFSGSVHFIFNSSSILSSKQNLLVSEEKTTDQVTRCPNDFDDISTSSEIMTGTTESNRRSGVGRYHDNRWYKDTKKMLRIILVSLNLK